LLLLFKEIQLVLMYMHRLCITLLYIPDKFIWNMFSFFINYVGLNLSRIYLLQNRALVT